MKIDNLELNAISKLALVDNLLQQDQEQNGILDFFCLDYLNSLEGLFAKPKEIKKYIRDNFKVDFSETEINTSLKKLAAKGFVEELEGSDRFSYSGFKILEDSSTSLEKKRQEAEDLEKMVWEEWRQSTIIRYGTSVKDHLPEIETGLKVFLNTLIVRHGLETTFVLNPSTSAHNIRSIVTRVNPILIDEISVSNQEAKLYLKACIPDFFHNPSTNRVRYIDSLLNSSFIWHVLNIDPTCSILIQQITKGQKLILDNNILYSLVGFHGDDSLRASHELLDSAKKLGYNIVITSKTLDEFHNSLKFQLEKIKKSPPVPQELARIASNNLTNGGTLHAFWEELAKQNISIDEFILERSHLLDLIKRFGIEESHKFRNDIEKSETLSEEMNLLIQTCGDFNKEIVEHDAFHKILVNKFRKGPQYKWHAAKAWFLTQDSKLLPYDRASTKQKNSIPFCITTGQWMQINRRFISRLNGDDQFEESFFALATQPYLRALLSGIDLNAKIQKVTQRIARFKNMSVEQATSIITDLNFVNSINLIDEDKEIDIRIDNKILEDLTKVEEEKNYEKQRREILEEKLLKSEQETESNQAQKEAWEEMYRAKEITEKELNDRIYQLISEKAEAAGAKRELEKVRAEAEQKEKDHKCESQKIHLDNLVIRYQDFISQYESANAAYQEEKTKWKYHLINIFRKKHVPIILHRLQKKIHQSRYSVTDAISVRDEINKVQEEIERTCPLRFISKLEIKHFNWEGIISEGPKLEGTDKKWRKFFLRLLGSICVVAVGYLGAVQYRPSFLIDTDIELSELSHYRCGTSQSFRGSWKGRDVILENCCVNVVSPDGMLRVLEIDRYGNNKWKTTPYQFETSGSYKIQILDTVKGYLWDDKVILLN